MAAGLDRVNLVIGRNDCGKSAFLEAVQLAEAPVDAVHRLRVAQRHRLRNLVKAHDFDRFWRPVFFDLDVKTGFSISVTRDDSAQQTVKVWQGIPAEQLVLEMDDDNNLRATTEDGAVPESGSLLTPPTWKLDIQISTYDGEQIHQEILGASTQVTFPRLLNQGSAWILDSQPVLIS